MSLNLTVEWENMNYEIYLLQIFDYGTSAPLLESKTFKKYSMLCCYILCDFDKLQIATIRPVGNV